MSKTIKIAQQPQKQQSRATQIATVLEELSHISATIGTQYTEENYQNLNLLDNEKDENLYSKLLKSLKTLKKLQSNNQNKTNLSTEQKFRRFFEWLKENGVDVSTLPLEVRYNQQEKGNGMFAKQAIKKGETLIEIPRSLMITTLSANKEKVNEIPASYIHVCFHPLLLFAIPLPLLYIIIKRQKLMNNDHLSHIFFHHINRTSNRNNVKLFSFINLLTYNINMI